MFEIIENSGILKLIGKTIEKIEGGLNDSEVKFFCTDGSVMEMYHPQSCCESVYLEDVVGNLTDLVGQQILDAYESEGRAYRSHGNSDGSGDWTFYHIKTNNWSYVLRWYGEDNYYSTSVKIHWRFIGNE